MWTDADRSRYRQAGDCLPSDLSDAEWDRLGPLIPTAKPGGRPRKTDMAFGDERDLLSSANRSPMAVSAARGLFASFDGLQHLPRLPAGGRVGGDLGGTARGAARTAGAGGQPQRRRDRQPVAEVCGKRGCAKSEADAVGYDAGKKVKGRKIHALVDTEGLPLRVWFTPPPFRTGTPGQRLREPR